MVEDEGGPGWWRPGPHRVFGDAALVGENRRIKPELLVADLGFGHGAEPSPKSFLLASDGADAPRKDSDSLLGAVRIPGTMDMIAAAKTLAKIFDAESSAFNLLEDAGLPVEKLQPWGTLAPVAYWRAILRELDKGLVSGGLHALLKAAAATYPDSDALRNFLEALPPSVSAASPVPTTKSPHTTSTTAGPETRDDEPEQFDVFLAHNSKDKPLVQELAATLRERKLRAWVDIDELVPGRPWQDGVERVLTTVRSVAVLVGLLGVQKMVYVVSQWFQLCRVIALEAFKLSGFDTRDILCYTFQWAQAQRQQYHLRQHQQQAGQAQALPQTAAKGLQFRL